MVLRINALPWKFDTVNKSLIMASPLSPMNDTDGYDPIFSVDINQRMQVPKRISVTGHVTEDTPYLNGDFMRPTRLTDTMDMKVPERIFVASGANEEADIRPPRDYVLDSADLPTINPSRVQTPPSKITLDMHSFPTAIDSNKMSPPKHANGLSQVAMNETKDSFLSKRPSAASLGDMSGEAVVFEELDLLRQQIAKISRRVVSLELEAQRSQQREVILYTVGVAFFVLKAILWLSKD